MHYLVQALNEAMLAQDKPRFDELIRIINYCITEQDKAGKQKKNIKELLLQLPTQSPYENNEFAYSVLDEVIKLAYKNQSQVSKFDLLAIDAKGSNLLHIAATIPDCYYLQQLLEFSILKKHINQRNSISKQTSLNISICLQNLKAMQVLLDRGAAIHLVPITDDEHPLSLAIKTDFIDGILLLLQYGAGIGYEFAASTFARLKNYDLTRFPMIAASIDGDELLENEREAGFLVTLEQIQAYQQSLMSNENDLDNSNSVNRSKGKEKLIDSGKQPLSEEVIKYRFILMQRSQELLFLNPHNKLIKQLFISCQPSLVKLCFQMLDESEVDINALLSLKNSQLPNEVKLQFSQTKRRANNFRKLNEFSAAIDSLLDELKQQTNVTTQQILNYLLMWIIYGIGMSLFVLTFSLTVDNNDPDSWFVFWLTIMLMGAIGSSILACCCEMLNFRIQLFEQPIRLLDIGYLSTQHAQRIQNLISNLIEESDLKVNQTHADFINSLLRVSDRTEVSYILDLLIFLRDLLEKEKKVILNGPNYTLKYVKLLMQQSRDNNLWEKPLDNLQDQTHRIELDSQGSSNSAYLRLQNSNNV